MPQPDTDKMENLAEQLLRRGRLPKRLRLLEAIEQSASLTVAAELTGVCYKTAWNHLRALTEQAGCALVDTRIGGATGGSSTLTDNGQQLLALLRARHTQPDPAPAAERHSDANASQNQRHHLSHNRADDTPALRFSARNQLAGRVQHIDTAGLLANVWLSIGSVQLVAQITRSSIERLQLRTGSEVYAIIKASLIKLHPVTHKAPEAPAASDQTNRLPGRILRCEHSANGRELLLQLAPGVELTVAQPLSAGEETRLHSGASVTALIDPTEIMLATAL